MSEDDDDHVEKKIRIDPMEVGDEESAVLDLTFIAKQMKDHFRKTSGSDPFNLDLRRLLEAFVAVVADIAEIPNQWHKILFRFKPPQSVPMALNDQVRYYQRDFNRV